MNCQSSYRLIVVRGEPLGFVIVYYAASASRETECIVGTFTDLGPHVLKLAREEPTFRVEYTRVGAMLVSMDRPNVDAQKGVGDVTNGESETE